MQYFTEINEQVQESMGSSQPEPERALEFLKKLEEFTVKIEKAHSVTKRKEKKVSESQQNQDGGRQSEMINPNIGFADKRRVSKTSD